MHAVIEGLVTEVADDTRINESTGEEYQDRRVFIAAGRETLNARVADEVELPEVGDRIRAKADVSAYINDYRGSKSARLSVRVTEIAVVDGIDVPARAAS